MVFFFQTVNLCQGLFRYLFILLYLHTDVVYFPLQLFVVLFEDLKLCGEIAGRQVLFEIDFVVFEGQGQFVFLFEKVGNFNLDGTDLVVFFLVVGDGLLAEESVFLMLDLLFELVHGVVVDLELVFEFEDLLFDLGVGFEVGLVLFGEEELLYFLVEGGDLLFEF